MSSPISNISWATVPCNCVEEISNVPIQTPIYQPEIIKDTRGSITVSLNGNEVTFKDVVLLPYDFANGMQRAEDWNWNWEEGRDGMHHSPGIREKDLIHYLGGITPPPQVVILTRGRGCSGFCNGKLEVAASLIDFLKNFGVDEVHIVKTEEAISLYKKLCEDPNKRVAAFIHSTC